jgi:internalin A
VSTIRVRSFHQKQTPIAGVPVEVLSGDDYGFAKLRAHFLDEHEGFEPVVDVKMMVLGNDGVGKTQFCRRLTGEEFQPDGDRTHGVMVVPMQLPAEEGRKEIALQMWDFGVRDLHHGTHALFMRDNAIFALLWAKDFERPGEYDRDGIIFRNRPLGYWVDYVRHLGGRDRAVIIVQTRCDRPGDEDICPVSERLIRRAFGRYALVNFSAATDRGRANLMEKLAESIAYLRERQGVATIGVARHRVKTKLEEMRAADSELPVSQRRHRTLTQAEFRRLCEEAELRSEPEFLLDYLHRAGVVFYRTDIFKDRIILDQSWALDAIYAVFDRTKSYDQLRRLGGRFFRSLLEALVWRDHSRPDQELFLEMMCACGVCFVHRKGDAKLGVEPEYIAPELLPLRKEIEREIAQRWDADTSIEEQEYRYEFLHRGLIRSIIAEIDSDPGVIALCWCDGLCVYDETTRSRALLEQRMDPGWGGRIVVQTRGGQARELLIRLCKLVEEKQNGIGLEAVRSKTKNPGLLDAIPEERLAKLSFYASDARVGRNPDRDEIVNQMFEEAGIRDDRTCTTLDEDALLRKSAAAPYITERSAKARHYVSYAWADATDPDREKIVDQACEEAERRGTPIIRDKATLNFGDNIVKFMQTIGEGDRILVVLSDKYLKSPSCMFELFEIWRNSRQDKAEFLRRVRIYTLGDAQIWKPVDRVKCAKYWKEQHEELKQAVNEAGLDVVGEEDFRNYKLMQYFAHHVSDILKLFADIVQPQNFDDLKTYGFGDPPRAPGPLHLRAGSQTE